MSKFKQFEQVPLRTRLSASLTRPADTTAYAAGDMVADSASAPTVNVLTGAALGLGRKGTIRALTLIDSAKMATAGDFEIWLFNAPYTLANDNAAFAPTDAVAETVQAIISLPGSGSFVGNAGVDAAGNRVYQVKDINKDFQCAVNSKNLYWALVVRNAFTPVSAEKFTLLVDLDQR